MIPFPWSFTCVVWPETASVETLRSALVSVSAVGLYFTRRLTVPPAATLRGRLPTPVTENEVSDTLNCEICTDEELGLEMATD